MNLSHLSIEQYAHKFIKVKQSTLFEPTKQDKVKALLQKDALYVPVSYTKKEMEQCGTVKVREKISLLFAPFRALNS